MDANIRGLLTVYGRRMRTDFIDGSFRLLQAVLLSVRFACAVLLSVSRVQFCPIVVVDVGRLSVLSDVFTFFVFACLFNVRGTL